jgi:hypothetical protein
MVCEVLESDESLKVCWSVLGKATFESNDY